MDDHNSLINRLKRYKEDTEAKVLIQDAIDEIESLRDDMRFLHNMSGHSLAKTVSYTNKAETAT